ncbi:MAG: ABC transporter permease [Armatimonadetes bacterium]|nr:ABC transporter permease [Armatimonadota bacterium]
MNASFALTAASSKRRTLAALRGTWVVFCKEALEARRDRRTLVASILLPILLMPAMTLGLPALARRQEARLRTFPARVAVVGAEYGEALVEAGARAGVLSVVEAADPDAALRRGDVDLVLVIPRTFQRDLGRGEASVALVYNGGDVASLVAREKARALVGEHALRLSRARLLAQGLDPGMLRTVRIRERDAAAGPQAGGALLARILPFLIAVWAVLGGMHVAVDVTAGERERGTLEVILSAPVSRAALVAGKFLTVAVAALAAVAGVLVATVGALRWAAPMLAGGPAAGLNPGQFFLLAVTLVPLIALVSAVALCISLLARSVREAQHYLMPLYLAVALPAMAVEFFPDWSRALWAAPAPVVSGLLAVRTILLGTASAGFLAASAASHLVLAALVLGGAVVILSRGEALHRA